MSEEMQAPELKVFSWDETNERHLQKRHPDIEPADVDSVLDGAWVWVPNVRGRATVLVLGIDRKGRSLAVPADPTGEPGVWRPRTAHQMTGWPQRTYDEQVSSQEEQ